MVLCFNVPGSHGALPNPTMKLLARSNVVLAAGEFFCSHTEITLTSVQSTSSMVSNPKIFPRIGAAVFSLLWCCGIQTTLAYMFIMLLITDSRRRRVIGDSHASSSTGVCSTCHGKAALDHCARMIPRISQPIYDLSRTRLVFYGTTSPTMTPKRRPVMLV